MDKFFAAILPSIEHAHLLGYAAAFLVALLETVIVVGLFLPGSTLLLLLGALAAHGSLDFAYLLAFAVAGAAYLLAALTWTVIPNTQGAQLD